MRARRMRARRGKAGFTLIELVAVVTIIAVLATLAVYGMRKYVQYAKTAEASDMIGAIKAGQSAYFDETHRYLSADPADSPDSFYPDSPAVLNGSIKVQWGAEEPACPGCINRYRILGVMPAAAVLFRYSTTAAGPGGDPSALKPGIVTGTFFSGAGPVVDVPFYTVFALCDLGNDGAPYTTFASTNLTNQVGSENVGE